MRVVQNFFLGKEDSVQKDSYIWNMAAGLLNAMQSVIILMVIIRTNGVYDAGIFTIAYASANLFLTIGNYGMRSYQVTDVKEHFSFNDYLGSRLVTCGMMLIVSFAYVAYGGIFKDYSLEKVIVLILICLLKLIDAIEDIYHGMFQQNNRLDIGSKALSLRLVITILVFSLSLVLTRNLLLSSLITVVISFFTFILSTRIIFPYFNKPSFTFTAKKVKKLLSNSFGVFAAAFLSFYIINTPKYAIDTFLSQDIQAYYGFIAMPVFVVGLLNNFLYQPILTSLALDWNQKRKKAFVKRFFRQIVIILFLTLCTLVGGYFIGIPVLSCLYHTDLYPFKTELMIVLCGGGILAIVGFMTIVLTIVRHQKDLIWCYLIVACLAFFLAPEFVKNYGITGASWVYTILVGILLILFAIVLWYRIRREY